jgi:tetratricopeptide (TPR) repeat protein
MSKNLKIIIASAAAAALLLAAVFSALERAETARGEKLEWSDIINISTTRGQGEAVAEVEKRLAAHPNDALLHYYRARLYYDADQGKEALEEADQAIELGYAQEISHLLKALVHGRLFGDRAKQRELASKALVYDPTYDDGYLVRAEANFALADYKACAADASSYFHMKPKELDGYELSLLCLEKLGDYSGAEKAGLALLKLKPDSHTALWRLGRVYAAQGLHKRAIKKISEAIHLSGGRPKYYLDRALSCEAVGDFSCAAWDYSSAMDWQQVSGYASYYYLLGGAMHRIGELKFGLEAAETAVAKAPSEPDYYGLRGRLRAELGDVTGAKKDFQALSALSPARKTEAAALLEQLKKK